MPRLPNLALFAFTALGVARADDALELFEKRIRPVLVSECIECHGAKKQKGGLRVDSREALRTGGDTGPAVVPGKPAESLLLKAIRHEDADMAMPQKRPKLGDAVIADFEKWIAAGATDPRDVPPKEETAVPWEKVFAERRGWWCFRPVVAYDPPPVKDETWSTHPVDRFLLAKMEERGLAPAPAADAQSVARRLSYALTGLPPDANEGTDVDKLLASPHFGEHWARHWMDLVRYAETHGSEGDPEIPWAYLYRDYLIAALNEDVPVDQLIQEHLAGDLLPHPRWNRAEFFNESAIGTAHLRFVEHGFQPVDTRDEQIKNLDSQIDVVMKAFQGLTVTCARCHDHKFDPISQRDYYAIQGVFANARPTMVTIDDPAHLAIHRDELTALKTRIRSALAEAWLEECFDLPERRPLQWTSVVGVDGQETKIPGLKWSFRSPSDVQQWFRHGSGLPPQIVPDGDFSVSAEGERVLDGVVSAGFHTRSLSARHNGILTSPRFRVESDFISVHAAGGAGAQIRLILDGYPIGNGGIFPMTTLKDAKPQWVRLDVKYRRGSWAYLEFATQDDLPRRERRETGAPSWFAVDAIAFHDAEHAPKDTLPVIRDLDHLAQTIRAWRDGRIDEAQRAALDRAIRSGLLTTGIADLPQVAPLVAEYRRIEAEVPTARRIPGVLDHLDADAPLLTRGEASQPAGLVPRGFLSAIDGTPFAEKAEQTHSKDDSPALGSGRLQLALALTDRSNPLTARVMVNRVWHWLFGRGLVATPDNFGRMGELPTHPELLDYLAAKFQTPVAEGGLGWSLKKLIRFLVTTRAFALASEPPAGALDRDPANTFLTHWRVRRLDAESIRDTLLVRAGQLDPVMWGPGENAFAEPAQQKRRSVYTVVRRGALSPFLTVFDQPKPFATIGRRDETNVPAQSLTLLNDPLVIHCAARWADRTLADRQNTEGRIRSLISAAFSRPATEAEVAMATQFLAGHEMEPGMWSALAHSLMNAKEFIYLR